VGHFGRIGAFALASAAALVMSTSGAMATTAIKGLFNTGVNAFGTPLVGHVADPHWTLSGLGVGPLAYTGGTNGVFPIGPWVPDNSSSRWITPAKSASHSFDPTSNGFYTYTLDFNMAAIGGAFFDAQFAADNEAATITLNGHSLLTGAGGYNLWTLFSADAADFVIGTNVLKIVVENFKLSKGNPTGLNVEFLRSGAGVPEPASWLMLILGFCGLGMLLRSRRALAFPA
jgi:hypothetical protein